MTVPVNKQAVRFGIIGAGLMGRECASAAARWMHLEDIGSRLEIAAVCDTDRTVLSWYERLRPRPALCGDYRELLGDASIDAVYVAVPHHLHQEVMIATLLAGKNLLGEKPFGIDLAANRAINSVLAERPASLVRISSEMPFYPGGQRLFHWMKERRFGELIEMRTQFLHSSDLDPRKPINWKRMARFNGRYGCMSDLGLHALHLPLRLGVKVTNVRALLSDVIRQRPDKSGNMVPCDTWDNAVLVCDAELEDNRFPFRVEMKRIAPGEANTWAFEVDGTRGSIRYTTKYPKTLQWMDYSPGETQVWRTIDLGSESAYRSITGAIFEFGFSDAVLQMLTAYVDELVHGEQGMRQPFYCATPAEVARTHELFEAALASHDRQVVVQLGD